VDSPGTTAYDYPIDLSSLAEELKPDSPVLLVDTLGDEQRAESAYATLRERFAGVCVRVLLGIVEADDEPTGALADCAIRLVGSALDAPHRALEELSQRIGAAGCRTVILNMTCMPPRIMLALIRWLVWPEDTEGPELDHVIAVYTKPKQYAPVLGGGYDQPVWVPGYGADYGPEPVVGWIPVLGFSARPTLMAREIIAARAQELRPGLGPDEVEVMRRTLLSERTYPIVGWPPYRPDFYNRALWENRDLLRAVPSESNRIVLASADDPFEVAQRIQEIVGSRPDLRFICSAQGSQPMNLGAGLACAALGIQLLHSFPTSRPGGPPTSGEPGESVAYWLLRKRD
jgi:hypothetical protein